MAKLPINTEGRKDKRKEDKGTSFFKHMGKNIGRNCANILNIFIQWDYG